MKARFLLVFALLLVHPTVCSAKNPITIRDEKLNLANTTATSNPSISADNNQVIKWKFNKPLSEFANEVKVLDNSLSTIGFFVVKVLATVSSIVVTIWIIVLIVNRPSQLIIGKFNNATGEEELDKVLPGLRQLARQGLTEEIKKLHTEKIEKTTDNQSSFSKSNLDQLFQNLITSLQKFTPDSIDHALELLYVIFPPRGTKVTSILQSQGNKHHKLGISYEISDLQGKVAPKLYTMWEELEENQPTNQEHQQDLPTDNVSTVVAIQGSNPKLPIFRNEYVNPHQEELEGSNQGELKDRYRELLKAANYRLARELFSFGAIIAESKSISGKKRQEYKKEVYSFFDLPNETSD